MLAPIRDFLRRETSGGILLMLAALLALLTANSPLAAGYHRLLDAPLYLGIGGWALHKPLVLWINDGLMALFFLVVGL